MNDAILRPVGFDGAVYGPGNEEAFAKAVKSAKNPPDMAALAKAGVIKGFGTDGKAAKAEAASESEKPAEAPKAKKGGKGKKKG